MTSPLPAAQQPSDLVKRLRLFNTANWPILLESADRIEALELQSGFDADRITELLDRIEALEADQKSLRLYIAELTEQLDIAKAAAAQPSEREAALVKAARGALSAMCIVPSQGNYFSDRLNDLNCILAVYDRDTPAKPDAGRP